MIPPNVDRLPSKEYHRYDCYWMIVTVTRAAGERYPWETRNKRREFAVSLEIDYTIINGRTAVCKGVVDIYLPSPSESEV